MLIFIVLFCIWKTTAIWYSHCVEIDSHVGKQLASLMLDYDCVILTLQSQGVWVVFDYTVMIMAQSKENIPRIKWIFLHAMVAMKMSLDNLCLQGVEYPRTPAAGLWNQCGHCIDPEAGVLGAAPGQGLRMGGSQGSLGPHGTLLMAATGSRAAGWPTVPPLDAPGCSYRIFLPSLPHSNSDLPDSPLEALPAAHILTQSPTLMKSVQVEAYYAICFSGALTQMPIFPQNDAIF